MEKQNETEGKLSELPACAAEFIKLVINKMRYHKKVREDVQAELAAHFEDELKDLATDDEKAQKVQQLIAGFGDVKLLAVLLRRAKKRCRPLWRTVVARAFQTVGVLILCFVLYVVWFLTGKPVITTDYIAELNRIVRPVADESLNAAPLYNKAAKMCENLPNDVSQLLKKKYYEVTLEEKQLVEKWLSANEEHLQLVIAGSQKPYYWQKYEGEDMLSILMPNLSHFRNLARTLCWRAHLRAEQGRYEDAFLDLTICYRFGRHVKGDQILLGQLVGVAIKGLTTDNLRSILSKYEIDTATLTMLQNDLERMAAGENFAMSFAGEKMFIYDEIQRAFTEDHFGGDHLYLSRIDTLGSIGDAYAHTPGKLIIEAVFSPEVWPRAVRVLFFHPDKQETRETTDRFYAYCDVIAQKTPGQIEAEGIDTEKETMEIIKDNVLLGIITPAVGRVCELGYRSKTSVQATITVLALLRYKADNGSYPEELQELITAGYLEQLPTDLYNVKPLIYKKTADSFTLYSIGPNFEDDGGKHGTDSKGRPKLWAENADIVFWPVPKS